MTEAEYAVTGEGVKVAVYWIVCLVVAVLLLIAPVAVVTKVLDFFFPRMEHGRFTMVVTILCIPLYAFVVAWLQRPKMDRFNRKLRDLLKLP